METPQKISSIKQWLGAGSINFFGRQFAGKDTQCTLVARSLDAAMFGGGDILRNSDTPKHAMDVINEGHLSPTDVYRSLVIPYFNKPEFAGRPIMLSTVGRMKGEETVVIEAAQKSGHEIKAVVVLNIEESETWKRYEIIHLLDREARDDDSGEAIQRRLQLFKDSTIPAINTYRELGIVIDVDGTLSPEAVHEKIIDALYAMSIA